MNRVVGCVAAFGLAVVVAAPGGAFAAAAAARTAAKPIVNPRDFSGVWMNNAAQSEQRDANGNPVVIRGERAEREPPTPPLTPEYLEIYKKVRAQMQGKGRDPSLGDLEVNGTAECKWAGMPTIMGWPFPLEFLQTPGRITILMEADSQTRRVYMDGRKIPPLEELDPTYNGYSIGRWEGNTLVIDTAGIKTSVLMNGVPHSEEARIVERIRLLDKDTLENTVTVTDPKAFTAPIVRKIVYGRRAWEIEEYSCAENNRNAVDETGATTSGISASQ